MIKLNELLKRIVDTCNYNEMNVDNELSIDYICLMTPILMNKNAVEVTESIIHPLMDQYRDTEDKNEINYIKDTITMVMEYMTE